MIPVVSNMYVTILIAMIIMINPVHAGCWGSHADRTDDFYMILQKWMESADNPQDNQGVPVDLWILPVVFNVIAYYCRTSYIKGCSIGKERGHSNTADAFFKIKGVPLETIIWSFMNWEKPFESPYTLDDTKESFKTYTNTQLHHNLKMNNDSGEWDEYRRTKVFEIGSFLLSFGVMNTSWVEEYIVPELIEVSKKYAARVMIQKLDKDNVPLECFMYEGNEESDEDIEKEIKSALERQKDEMDEDEPG